MVQAAFNGPLIVLEPPANSAVPVPVKVLVPSKTKSPANCNNPPLASNVPSVDVPPPESRKVPLCADTVPEFSNSTCTS